MAHSRHILHTPIHRCRPPPTASGTRTAPDRPAADRPPGPRAARTTPSPGLGRRRTTARAAPRRFLRCERASVAIESAFALFVLVGGFGSLMHIVGDVFTEDHAGRSARTVARAIALDPSADPWAALKREGGLDASATCPEWKPTANTCGGWTLKIDRGVAPAALPDDLTAGVSSRSGELVLVRLERGGSLTFGLARSEPRS